MGCVSGYTCILCNMVFGVVEIYRGGATGVCGRVSAWWVKRQVRKFQECLLRQVREFDGDFSRTQHSALSTVC